MESRLIEKIDSILSDLNACLQGRFADSKESSMREHNPDTRFKATPSPSYLQLRSRVAPRRLAAMFDAVEKAKT